MILAQYNFYFRIFICILFIFAEESKIEESNKLEWEGKLKLQPNTNIA